VAACIGSSRMLVLLSHGFGKLLILAAPSCRSLPVTLILSWWRGQTVRGLAVKHYARIICGEGWWWVCAFDERQFGYKEVCLTFRATKSQLDKRNWEKLYVIHSYFLKLFFS